MSTYQVNAVSTYQEKETLTFVIGVLLCRAHLESLLAFVRRGVEEGATLLYGGRRLDRKGERSRATYNCVLTFFGD